MVTEFPLLLALASALTWGAGDFFGGLATRQAKAIATTLTSQFVGLLGLIGVSLLGAGGSLAGKDLAWGTGAGLCAVTGLGLFYEAMGRGVFGPVASVTSVVSGGIPIVVGLLLGERPTLTVLFGVYVAVVAIWLIAGEKSKPGDADNPRSAMLLAAGAGVFFGAYFVLLSRTSGDSGLWTLVAGRLAASVALIVTILVLGYGDANAMGLPDRRSLRLAAVAGVLDASANAFYFYASRNGLLSVVAVVASMYPASTILLARVALHETVNRRRLAGMVAGLVAVSVIARGGSVEVSSGSPGRVADSTEPSTAPATASTTARRPLEPSPTPPISSPPTTDPDGWLRPSSPPPTSPPELALTAPDDAFWAPHIEPGSSQPPDDFWAPHVEPEPTQDKDDFWAPHVEPEPTQANEAP